MPFRKVFCASNEKSVYDIFGIFSPLEIFGYTFGLPLTWACGMFFLSIVSNIVLWLCLTYPKFNKKKETTVNLIVNNNYNKIKIYFEKI